MKRGTTIIFSVIFMLVSAVALAQPAKPSLTLPSNGAVKVALTDNLVWNSGPVDSFRVQIATDTSFATPIFDTVQNATNVYQFKAGLLKRYTIYYWRAQGKDIGGFGSWSDVSNFRTIDSAAIPPLLQKPANNAKSVSLFPDFQWSQSQRAQRYQIQLSVSAAFSPLLMDSVVNSPNNVLEFLKDTLEKSTIHYWRVRSENETGWGDWSSIFSFEPLFLPPVKPVIFGPANNATNVSLTPVFDWTDSKQTTRYRIIVSQSPTLFPPVYRDSLLKNSHFWYHGDTLKLNPSTVYYWAVAAGNDADFYSRNTDTFKFTTGAQLPPLRPVNVSPKSSAVQQSRIPTFTWNTTGSIPVDSFYIHISTFNNFTDTTLLSVVTPNSFTPAAKLPYKTVLYWRVAGKNSGGFSPWSYFWNLTTGINQPVENAFEGKLYPNPVATTTTLEFELKQNSDVRIAVTDISGREVLSVFNGTLTADKHSFAIDASALAAGTYFAVITDNNQLQTIAFTKP